MGKEQNPMRNIGLEKVTVNMGVGETGEVLDKASTILETVTKAKPSKTVSKVKNPTWGLRLGLPIGIKVTLRGKKANEFLTSAFAAKDNRIEKRNFDPNGNFGFGVKEHIDMPGVKYDPKFGIRGFDVLVTLERPGYRIKRRKLNKRKVGKNHKISKENAVKFIQEKFGVEVE